MLVIASLCFNRIKRLQAKMFKLLLFVILVSFIHDLRKQTHSNNDELYSINISKQIEELKNLNHNVKCDCRNESISVIKSNQNGYQVLITGRNPNTTKVYNFDLMNTSMRFSCDLFKLLRRGVKQNVISYSLFGKDDIYFKYIKDIIIRAKILFPNWTVRFYHDGKTLHQASICKLECLKSKDELLDNVDFCDISNLNYEHLDIKKIIPQFWRWLPINDDFVDRFVSRDSDSCLIQREKDAMDEWLASNKLFHIMRGMKKLHSNMNIL
jgi:hypothetical protein